MATTDKWKLISMFSALAYRLQLDSGYSNIKSAGRVNFTTKHVISPGSVKLSLEDISFLATLKFEFK